MTRKKCYKMLQGFQKWLSRLFRENIASIIPHTHHYVGFFWGSHFQTPTKKYQELVAIGVLYLGGPFTSGYRTTFGGIIN